MAEGAQSTSSPITKVGFVQSDMGPLPRKYCEGLSCTESHSFDG